MPHTTSTALSKIPALTFLFWVMKIAATTLGETAGDLFSMTMGIGYMWSTLILMSGFAGDLSEEETWTIITWLRDENRKRKAP